MTGFVQFRIVSSQELAVVPSSNHGALPLGIEGVNYAPIWIVAFVCQQCIRHQQRLPLVGFFWRHQLVRGGGETPTDCPTHPRQKHESCYSIPLCCAQLLPSYAPQKAQQEDVSFKWENA